MNFNMRTQDNTWRNVGLITLAAGLLAYPVYRLVKYVIDKRNQQSEEGEESHPAKNILPSYRGKHKPHHRKADSNGHITHSMS
jgi:hypothetical protein